MTLDAVTGASVVVDGLTWTPVRRRRPVLDGLDLEIAAGQRVLLAGPSGSGKSTLLRALAGLLLAADHGRLDGRVLVDGAAPDVHPGQVGLLLQDPRNAVVAETIGRDVAFGLENQCVPAGEMWPRVRAALTQLGLAYPLDHPTGALSGGESQRLALAGSLALNSRLLLLDEPTSMLDTPSAELVRASVHDLVIQRNTTLVVVEHHLEPWLDLVDRIIVLGATGQVVADGPPRAVFEAVGPRLVASGIWVPGADAPTPTVYDPALVAPAAAVTLGSGEALVSAAGVSVTLRSRIAGGRTTTVALNGVNADLVAGRTLAVLGDSGAGKSTLVSVLAGLERPTAGGVVSAPALATRRGLEPWRWRSRDLAARLAWVPQFPEQGVVARTVLDEVLATSRAVGRDDITALERALGLIAALGLAALAEASPYHLSGGEQRRLALASAFAHGAAGLLLDEPTVGQDRLTWQAVTGAITSAARAGTGVAVATHDAVAARRVADDHLTLSRGRVAP